MLRDELALSIEQAVARAVADAPDHRARGVGHVVFQGGAKEAEAAGDCGLE